MAQVLVPWSLALMVAVPLSAQDTKAVPAAPIAAALDDVAFISGHWIGGEAGDLSEEIWSGPEGDSMMGVWRYVSKGKTHIFEMLALTQEGPHVVLRLRHLDPKLVAREEKDRAVELPLVAKSKDEAVFEGAEYEAKTNMRITYRRAAPDTLTCVLEKGAKPQTFTFKRR